MKIRKRSSRLASENVSGKGNGKKGGKSLQLDVFDSEPGYYQHIIRPLLMSSNGEDLLNWLMNTKLIKSEQICSKRMVDCNSPMSLVEVKGPDLFQWKCEMCLKRKSIRDDSIFSDLKCNFKNAIRIILAWCKGYHVDYVSNILGIGNSVIQELYIKAASVAEKYMKSNIGKWQIGGPGVVVVVDTYPEGCMNTSLSRMNRPILCISEIKTAPQKYWLETLDNYSQHNVEHIKFLKRHISRTIQTVVRPGSILVTPAMSTLCSWEDLRHLSLLYPVIVSVEHLSRHNNDRQNVYTNLEIIWKQILDICEEAQYYCSSYVDLFVISHMWRRMFGSEAFEMLLYQISAVQ